MKLFYNTSTKIVFGSNDEQTDTAVREINRDEIPDLIANGATVDPSADAPAASTDASIPPQTPVPQGSTDTACVSSGNAAPVAPAPAASATTSATAGDAAAPVAGAAVEVIPVVSGATTLDVAKPQETTPGTSIDPNAPQAQPDQTPAVPLTGDDKIAQEQADVANGVDTNRNVESVLLHPVTVGGLAGTPVTPDGTPVVDAQPEAVSVKGPEVRSTSPAAAVAVVNGATGDAAVPKTAYDDLDHEGMIEQLLDDLAGFANMGRSEIAFVVDSLRGAFHRSKKGA